MKKAYVKTRRDYERELIELDEQLFEIQEQMENLKQKFIDSYGIYEWDEMFDRLRHTV